MNASAQGIFLYTYKAHTPIHDEQKEMRLALLHFASRILLPYILNHSEASGMYRFIFLIIPHRKFMDIKIQSLFALFFIRGKKRRRNYVCLTLAGAGML
jgi:hypothetical protein